MVEVPVTRYVSVGGAEIAYQVVGDGPVDLVFNHGVCHLDFQWDIPPEAAFNRRLASFSRLILFDRRGTGASERATGNRVATWEEWTEDLRAVLDAVGSERAAIFAETDAVPPALAFAASNPDRVSKLILANASARFLYADDYPIGLGADYVEAVASWAETEWGTPELIRTGFPSIADEDDLVERLAKLSRAAGTPAAMGRQTRYMYDALDVRSVLPLVLVPTLVLQSAHPILSPAQIRYVAEHIPNARLVEVPGIDHLLFTGDVSDTLDLVAEFVTGERPAPVPTRILTTMVFTDIVGSTRHAAELGDRRWRELLDAHDRMTRDTLRQFRGRVVNTTGDGFFAAFDGPAQAVRCAQAVTAGAEDLGLHLRVGIHTGECEVRGDDLSGLAVHIAYRVGDLAGPGEVYVSEAVRELTVGSELEFDDCGQHALKGVPGEWPIFSAKSATGTA